MKLLPSSLLLAFSLTAPVAGTFQGIAQAQTPPASPALPPLTQGEISLEGHVISVDTAHHTAVLAANRFFLPNGKSEAITPPKNKVINWEHAGFPRNTTQQLKAGLQIRVSGKDLGSGKTLPARFIVFLGNSGSTPPPTNPTTNPTNQSATGIMDNLGTPGEQPKEGFPIEAADKEWKFRVLDAGFMPADSPEITTNNREVWSNPSFVASYAAQNPKGEVMYPQNWFQTETVEGASSRSSTIRARVISPQGVAYPAEITSDNVVSSPQVDPKWPFVWLELFGRDPQAPDNLSNRMADGEFRQFAALDFAPPANDTPVELNKNIKTSKGAQITVKTIQLKREGQGGTISFTLTVQAQPNEYISDFTGPSIVDAEGKDLQNGGSGGSEGDDYHFELSLDTLPTDTTWHARFDLVEVQRAQATAANRFLVRFKIPLTSKTARRPFATNHTLTKAPVTNGLEASIEDDGSPIPFWWSGRLWLHNLSPDKSRFWSVNDAQFFLPDGKELDSNAESTRTISYWHRDGSPASGLDNNQKVTAFFPDNATRPQTIKGRFELQSQRALDYAFTVKATVPKPGETIKEEAEIHTENNAPFTLLSTTYYQSLDELKGLTDRYQLTGSGLVLIFDVKPLLVDSQLNLYSGSTQAYDNAMRPLHSDRGLRWMNVNVLTGEQGNFWTLFVPAPALDAQNIEVSTQTQEKTTSAQTVTIEIPNIPVAPVQQ